MASSDPRIRASDEDRDRAATLLREHHAVGRLTAEEFNERLDKVYAAKTMGDLDELLADLPAIDLYRLPDASLPRYREARRRARLGSGLGAVHDAATLTGAARQVLAALAARPGDRGSATSLGPAS